MTAKAPRQDLATIEAELAAKAAEVSKQVGRPESKKITVDRNGNFIAAGGVSIGNSLEIVVVDFCSANDYYTAVYDPNNPSPPVCFARGREIEDMIPEDESPEKQSNDCASCPHNQFGSRGNGKACKNTRNLAVVLANELGDPDVEPELHLIQVPPTGLKSFDAAALQAARMFNGPPIKCVMTVRVVQQGQYNTLQFGDLEPNDHLLQVWDMREEAEDMIARTPDLTNYKPTRQNRSVPARR